MSNFKWPKDEEIEITESQTVSLLKEYEGGKSAEKICRDAGISKQTFYTV